MQLTFSPERSFYHTLFSLALPIIIQNFIQSSLNFVDNLVIGQLGEQAIAGVGLANQYYFLISIILSGIISGTSIFTAQLWGKKDETTIKKFLGICLSGSFIAATVAATIGIITPEKIIKLFISDVEVISLGSSYLRMVAWSYPLGAITLSFSSVLRSIGKTKTPTLISIISLVLNTIISYLLVYGLCGLPQLGVSGAALGTLISRLLELILLMEFIYGREKVINIKISDYQGITSAIFGPFLKVTFPVILSEIIWGLGICAYTVAYASISTEAIAAKNIMNTVESLTWVLFIGIGNACSIMIGNKLGQANNQETLKYAKQFIRLGVALSLVISLIIVLTSHYIVSLFKVSALVRSYSINTLYIMAAFLLIRVINYICLAGLLRSGGDTKFCFWTDLIGVWIIGVPLTFLAAKVGHWEVHWVYAVTSFEEVYKFIASILRVRSKKWLNNLTTLSHDKL